MVDFTPQAIVSDITYGLGLLSSFGQQVDVVGIYNGSVGQGPGITPSIIDTIANTLLGGANGGSAFGQKFGNARPLKATVYERSKVMYHPGETGITLADHHIIEPVEILLPLVVTSEFYAGTYQQIRQAFTQATLLSVKTRTGVYQSMVIAEMPHEEDPEMYDAITIGLKLVQILFVVPGTATVQTNYQPLSAVNANTVSSGLQQGVALAGRLLTTATSFSSYASTFKKRFL